MKTTTNHGLKKPDGTDTVNIEDLNHNADVLDGILVPATTTTNGLMSKDDKTKLNGIATGANKYTHPATHPASMISGLHAIATSGSYEDLLNKPATFPPSTHTHDYLPTSGGTITGNFAVRGDADFNGNVGFNGELYCKVDGIVTTVANEISSLKSTVVSGKQSVANAINGKLGTALSNQTPFDDMAYYISNGLISSPTSATCGSFTLTFGNNFTTKNCYIVRSAYKIYGYSLYGVAVTYQVYKKPSGGSLSLLYSGTISTTSPIYTQLTDGDNTAVYFIFFGASGVTLHATNANGSGNATFDYCI